MGLVYTVVNQAYEGNVMGLVPILAMVVLAGAGLFVKTNRGYIIQNHL